MGGIQRSATVTSRRPVGWARVPDLGWGSRPKLHGMQEFISKSIPDAMVLSLETRAPKNSKAAGPLSFLKSMFILIDGCLRGSKSFTGSVY
jgi:hypothetical protein